MYKLPNGYLHCGKCDEIKLITEFYRNANRKTGRSGHCKKCADSYPYRKNTGKGQIKKDPEYVLITKRICGYKCGAKARGYKFLLTRDEFLQLCYKPCHYCGGYNQGKGKPHCGIDRVDNSIGYVFSNCVPCCYTCNIWKHTRSIETFIEHAKKIASRF